ncbi:MAG: hypothetical protein AABY26_01105, partial [Nanoarchaeota archaeon]
MTSWKNIFTSWRVILLIVLLLFAYITINGGFVPHFWDDGVTIRSVESNSSASKAGMHSPSAKLTPLAKERILSINGKEVSSLESYYSLTDSLGANQTVTIKTSQASYTLLTPAKNTGETDLGLSVYTAPTSNLRKGLELEGGTRVLLKPSETVSPDVLDATIDTLKERLNVYGLSDVVVRSASDLEGGEFILIEIAGVTEEEVKQLLSQQGKFE